MNVEKGLQPLQLKRSPPGILKWDPASHLQTLP